MTCHLQIESHLELQHSNAIFVNTLHRQVKIMRHGQLLITKGNLLKLTVSSLRNHYSEVGHVVSQ